MKKEERFLSLESVRVKLLVVGFHLRDSFKEVRERQSSVFVADVAAVVTQWWWLW